MTLNYKQLATQAAPFSYKICQRLFPHGKFTQSKCIVGGVHGERGKSMTIELEGSKAGKFKDHENPEHRGDLIELAALSLGMTKWEAYKFIAEQIGVEIPKFEGAKKEYAKPKQVISHSDDNKVFDYLHSRGISRATAEKYGVLGDQNSIIFRFIRDGELVNVKRMSLSRDSSGKKRGIRFESGCELCLYGWDSISPQATNLAICEGEIDAMSLSEYGIDALSVPNGCSNTVWIDNDFDRLGMYENIYLFYDNDESGQKGALEAAKRLGLERCYNVKLPYKDANDCLKNGISVQEILKAMAMASSFDPEELINLFDNDAIDEAMYGKPGEIEGWGSPWRSVNERVNFSKRGLSVWNGINGHGKTSVLNHLAAYWMNKGARVCVASMEVPYNSTVANFSAILSGMAKPKSKDESKLISKPYLRECQKWLEDNRLWVYNHLGRADPNNLEKVFRYAARKYGIDIFIIDSLSRIKLHSDNYSGQEDFMDKLCAFNEEFNCHVHLVTHPRKMMAEEVPPTKFDVKGSGIITDLADNVFIVWRNKKREQAVAKLNRNETLNEIDEKSLAAAGTYLNCCKQRELGEEGVFGLYRHSYCPQYLTKETASPVRYVNYSNQKEKGCYINES